jgi:hypothetical protein
MEKAFQSNARDLAHDMGGGQRGIAAKSVV